MEIHKDIFDTYKSDNIYIGLNNADYFNDEMSKAQRVKLLNDCFLNSTDYDQAIKNLKQILNQDGLSTFRQRYKKYKYALKSRANIKAGKSITITVSRDVGLSFNKIKGQLGFESDTEALEYLVEIASPEQ